MNIKTSHFIPLFLLLLTSCAPKVNVDLTSRRQPSVFPEEVAVYQYGDSIPANAELVGYVKVYDSDFSLGCSYDKMIDEARKATATSGGNALTVSSATIPGGASSCHHIAGNILFVVPDENGNVALAPSPFVSPQDLATFRENEKLFFHHTVFGGIGVGFLTSTIDKGNFTKKPTTGLDWIVGYDWKAKSGFGFGLLYQGNWAPGKVMFYESDNFIGHDNLSFTYIAPQFVVKQNLPANFQIEERVGFGFFQLMESSRVPYKNIGKVFTDYSYGFGVNVGFGANYTITRNIGVFGKVMLTSAIFNHELKVGDRDVEYGAGLNQANHITFTFGASYSF